MLESSQGEDRDHCSKGRRPLGKMCPPSHHQDRSTEDGTTAAVLSSQQPARRQARAVEPPRKWAATSNEMSPLSVAALDTAWPCLDAPWRNGVRKVCFINTTTVWSEKDIDPVHALHTRVGIRTRKRTNKNDDETPRLKVFGRRRTTRRRGWASAKAASLSSLSLSLLGSRMDAGGWRRLASSIDRLRG